MFEQIKKSIALKITLLQSCLIAIGLMIVITIQYIYSSDMAFSNFKASHIEKSQLLTDQMRGGIRWKKPSALEKIYLPMAQNQNSNLASLSTYDESGQPLSTFVSEHFKPVNFSDFPNPQTQKWPENHQITIETPDYLINFNRVWNQKKNQAVGYVSSAWSKQSLNSQIQAITQINIIIAVTLMVLIPAVLSVFLRKVVVTPLIKTEEAMTELANDNHDVSIPYKDRQDEIGNMASSLMVFKRNSLAKNELERQQQENALRSQKEKELAGQRLEMERIQAIQQQEELILKELSGIIKACSEGNFSIRLNTHGKQGLLLQLTHGLNQIAEICQQGITGVNIVVRELEQGNLAQRMQGNYQGIFSEIQLSLNRTIDHLSEMVVQIKEASLSVNDASKEIASAGQDLAERTSEQAFSLEKVVHSTDELSELLQKNLQNAQTARTLSGESSQLAVHGDEIVSNTIVSMQKIQESSRRVGDIIRTIDEIAFQTNLLALNAAVEAARAGEAGKGFAVVASEVRILASRSADASQEIRELITNSIEEVNTGVSQVNDSGDSLKRIVTSINEVSRYIQTITHSTESQNKQVDEFRFMISKIDEVTQQNAALVEENAAAAQMVADQGSQLNQLISFFKTESGNSSSRLSSQYRQKVS